MSEITKRLRDRRLNVWEQAKGLADTAAEENRAFSAEEQGTWDALNEELNKLDTRIKSAMETEQRGKDADAAFAKLEGRPVERGSREGAGKRDGGEESGSGDELRAWMRGAGPRFFEVNPTRSVNELIEQRDYTGLGRYSGAAGQNTVPTDFYDRLVVHLIQNAAIMQAGVTVLNTAGGETIQIPKTTAHSTASIVTEAAAITESEPTFGQISLGAYKYGTLVQVSRELLDDTGVDLEGYLAMQTGRALGNAFGAHAITGSGTSQPHGVVHDATSGVTGADGAAPVGAPGYEDIVDLFHSVIAPYRNSQSCHWMLNDTTVGVLRKIRTESGGTPGTGMPIWQPSMQVGAPDLLLGKPVLTDPNVAAVGDAAKSLLFGDFSTYFVRLAGGIRFERSDDFAFSSDLVTFRALMRADGALVDLTGSVKYFTGGGAGS